MVRPGKSFTRMGNMCSGKIRDERVPIPVRPCVFVLLPLFIYLFFLPTRASLCVCVYVRVRLAPSSMYKPKARNGALIYCDPHCLKKKKRGSDRKRGEGDKKKSVCGEERATAPLGLGNQETWQPLGSHS